MLIIHSSEVRMVWGVIKCGGVIKYRLAGTIGGTKARREENVQSCVETLVPFGKKRDARSLTIL